MGQCMRKHLEHVTCASSWLMGVKHNVCSHEGIRLQENASKRDDVPPSQGGKYVGFGSGPPPAAPRRGQAGGLDDVSVALSKGFSQLTTVAGRTETFLLILSSHDYARAQESGSAGQVRQGKS